MGNPTHLTTRALDFTALGTGNRSTVHHEWPAYFPVTLSHADGLNPGLFIATSIHDTDNPWVALVGVDDVQETPRGCPGHGTNRDLFHVNPGKCPNLYAY